MISGVRVASLSEVVSETFDFGMKRWGLLAGVFAVSLADTKLGDVGIGVVGIGVVGIGVVGIGVLAVS